MTEQQILVVRRTWKALRQIDPMVVGDTFYSKLFSDHPGLRKMFPKEMDAQYRKLMDMLSITIARMGNTGVLPQEFVEMARRHINYGVKPVHFEWVGNALLWTLRQGLGADWTAEVSKAWTECYNNISSIMINSFQQP